MRELITLLIALSISLGFMPVQCITLANSTLANSTLANSTCANCKLADNTIIDNEPTCKRYLKIRIEEYNNKLVQSVKSLSDSIATHQMNSLNLNLDGDIPQLTEVDRYILECYNKSISSSPNDEQLWLDLGDFYATLGINQGDSYRDEALDCYDNASKKNFSDIRPLIKKAKLYYKYRDEGKAIEICDIVLLVDTNSWEAWYIKGLAYKDLNKNEEAINCFNESLRLNESNGDAFGGLASTLINAIMIKLNDEHFLRDYNKRHGYAIKAYTNYAKDYLNNSENLNNYSKGFFVAKGDFYYMCGLYNQKLLDFYIDTPDVYKEKSTLSENSYIMAREFYTEALILDPSDCKLWGKMQELLSRYDYQYCDASNYAGMMAQNLGCHPFL